MTHANETTHRRIDLADLFADLDIDPHEEWLHNKREDVAIVLTSMLYEAGISRAQLAKKLGWKPSRVTRALSGDENLTINTLSEIINAAGYDFDMRLRRRGETRAMQPWEEATTVRNELTLARQLLDKSTSIYNEANHHLIEAQAMKATAEAINRRQFMNKNYTKQYAAFEQKPLLQEKRAA